MNTRRLPGFLVAILGTGLFVPLPAHALVICDPTINPACGATDVIEIVDRNGNIMNDVNGNPAVAFIHESTETTAPVLLGPVLIPDVISLPQTVSVVDLVEQTPDPTTHVALISDSVGVDLSSETNGTNVSVDFNSDTEVQQTGVCASVNPACIVETGSLEDVTGLLQPDMQQLSFRVLVQSDPPEVVPEPGTLLLLSSGLAGLVVIGGRRRPAHSPLTPLRAPAKGSSIRSGFVVARPWRVEVP